VYVIAISKITHHLSEHLDFSGFLDYTYLFIMIFWGWLNGSLHHDMHGSAGMRTNLMTLWQIGIVAALVVTLPSAAAGNLFNTTIAIMAMQLYITYLWWSVGIYDKAHRKLNIPYTLCFLASFVLMFITLCVGASYTRGLFYLTLALNYLPPFLSYMRLSGNDTSFSLSASMTERLGLFTIIIFGEVVLGVINGVSELDSLGFQTWINFALAILIIFTLWWLFFSAIADRKSKKGFLKSNVMAMAYIPTLMALSAIGIAFSHLFYASGNDTSFGIKMMLAIAISVFLLGIVTLTALLEYPVIVEQIKRNVQKVLLIPTLLIVAFTAIDLPVSLFVYLSIILLILLGVMGLIYRKWFVLEINRRSKQS
jgi:low temperature requirement protein LtrA